MALRQHEPVVRRVLRVGDVVAEVVRVEDGRRCAADIDDVGCPEPAAVDARIASTQSCAASSSHSTRLSTRPSPMSAADQRRKAYGSPDLLGARAAPATLCRMSEYKEVRVERLYVTVPNTDKLRRNAAGRHRHLLADGWREVQRRQEPDHVWVRYERTGQLPLHFRLPKGPQEVVRFERRPRGGGPGAGRFGGGPGAGRFGGGAGRSSGGGRPAGGGRSSGGGRRPAVGPGGGPAPRTETPSRTASGSPPQAGTAFPSATA